MSRRRNYLGMLIYGVVVVLLVVSIVLLMGKKQEGVTVATASRELALLLDDRAEIEAVEGSRFAAGERGNWYVPYMEYLYEKGLISEQVIQASPKGAAETLTLEGLKVMADHLGIWQSAEHWVERTVTPELWTEFLTEVMGRFAGDKVKKQELSVFGTAANISEVAAWHVVTERGEYTFGGFSMDTYLDRQVQVWVRGREIIRVCSVVSPVVNYENMLVKGLDEDSMTVFFSGYSREFVLTESAGLYPEDIIDLELCEGLLQAVRRKRDTIDGRIIAVTSDGAELEGYGKVPFASNMRIYQTYGNVSQKSSVDIVIGYDIYEVVVAEGEICAILIKQSPDAGTIRVLLTEGSGAVKCHPTVTVTSRSAFTVSLGTETVVFQPEELFTVGGGDVQDSAFSQIADGQRLVIEADCGELTVTSLTRTFGNPTYPGTLEILCQDGGFYLINDTQLEDYLCYVVPAEMPVDYHLEALKAQAICARGYAVNQITSTRYRNIGAHVDDTVNYQVYNYHGSAESTTQAVRETYGKVLTRDDDIVTTYYFSTSCGYTSDIALWGEDPEKSPHLSSKRLSAVEPAEDVRNEEVFRAFIRNTELNDYEIAYGWYRWNTSVSLDELTVNINSRLANISSALKSRVLTKQRDGSWKAGATGVGRVEKIEVLERGAGGVASTVEITGSQATVRLLLQSAIREVLGSAGYKYLRINGSEITGWANLPSAYFYTEPVYTDGELTGYLFYGGGCGHGVGMSQNGANAMGQSGVDAEAMLKFFYDGTDITQLYE